MTMWVGDLQEVIVSMCARLYGKRAGTKRAKKDRGDAVRVVLSPQIAPIPTSPRRGA